MSLAFDPTTIFDRSVGERSSARFPAPTNADAGASIPAALRRTTAPRLPQVTEPQLVRHYTRLSQRNFSIDTAFYPLGSCTMKYNPKVHDAIASLPGFAHLHPAQDPADAQGALRAMFELQHALSTLTGLPGVTLQPSAGAHGEFTGLMLMKAYHEHRVREGIIPSMPTHVLIPDTAHGTNPASVTMAGFATLSVPTNDRGGMDVDAMRDLVASHSIVGLMLTNPSTTGLFEEQIAEIAEVVHEAGGLLYYDGANFNAIMGKTRPGDMGFDIVHFNVHKTFSTPHGGGGPGAGPVAVRDILVPFLPVPRVERAQDGTYIFNADYPLSIGRIKQFWGNVGVLVRAWAYIRTHGREGLVRATELAVLNANYLLARVSEAFAPSFGRRCMHEFVVSAADIKREHGVRALDIAKRLIDFGFHPPTVYFPLLIEEALMVEPTETETRATLDHFADALLAIVEEARTNPDVVTTAPHTAPVKRLDEARAVRDLVLRWTPPADEHAPEAPATAPASAASPATDRAVSHA